MLPTDIQELEKLHTIDASERCMILSDPMLEKLPNLKNLVTDKPAPITVKLAQTKDSLLGENITTANLKNLVTDKPAPITVKLAQIHNKPMIDQLLQLEKKEGPTLTVDGDTATGMVGDEEIHGWARVGGSGVTYKRQ